MRRIARGGHVLVLTVCAVVLVGCESSGIRGPEDIDSCGGVVEAAVNRVVVLRDSSADFTREQFLFDDDEIVALRAAFFSDFEALSERAISLGCDVGELQTEYRSKVLELRPKTEGGLVALDLAVVVPFFFNIDSSETTLVSE